MKHAQKMVMIPEQLMQSMELEHRLNAPPQLPTLMRLDEDIKNIIESKLPEDQKIILLEQLIQRYQGLTKQMKSEKTVAPPVVLPPPTELVPATPSTSITVEGTASTSKIPRPVARSELKRKQDKPVQEETPLFSGKPVFLETPLSTFESKKKKRKARTPMVARLRSNRQWEPY